MEINYLLQVGQRDQTQFQRSAYRLPTIGRTELPEYVVKMRFNRRRA